MSNLIEAENPSITRRGFVQASLAVLGCVGFGGIAGALLAGAGGEQPPIQAPNSTFRDSVISENPNEAQQLAVLNRINDQMQELFKKVKEPSRLADYTYSAFITKLSTAQHVEDPKGILATDFPDEKLGESVADPYAVDFPNSRQVYAWDADTDIESMYGFDKYVKQRNEKTGEERIWTVRLPEDMIHIPGNYPELKPYFWRINYTDRQGHITWRVSFFTVSAGDKGRDLKRSPAFDGESFLKPPMTITINNPYFVGNK